VSLKVVKDEAAAKWQEAGCTTRAWAADRWGGGAGIQLEMMIYWFVNKVQQQHCIITLVMYAYTTRTLWSYSTYWRQIYDNGRAGGSSARMSQSPSSTSPWRDTVISRLRPHLSLVQSHEPKSL